MKNGHEMFHHAGSSLSFPTKEYAPVPALPPYIIEPIWQQFEALLPERRTDHPLGCHRSRISERVVFEKLVQVLVFGCAYERIADASCSESTLRRRRDEWIELGLMERLRQICLEAYDRLIGLELSEVAVDGCVTKAPCGGEKARRSRVDRGKRGIKRSMAVDAKGIPLGAVCAPANRHDSPLLVPTRQAASEVLGALPEEASVHLDRGYDSRLTRERLAELGLRWEISGKGKPAPLLGHKSVGGREDKLLAQRPQEAGLVYGAGGEGDRLLGGLLRRGDHRKAAGSRRLDTLSLGGATIPTTMSPIDGSSKCVAIRTRDAYRATTRKLPVRGSTDVWAAMDAGDPVACPRGEKSPTGETARRVMKAPLQQDYIGIQEKTE